MSRKLLLGLAIGLVLFIILVILVPTPASADGPDPGRYKPDVSLTRVVQTRVETRSDGVYVVISVHESSSGSQRPQLSTGLDPASSETNAGPATAPSTASVNQPVSTVPRDRYWTNATGMYRETPDGHVFLLTPPPIGSGSLDAWTGQLQQHPNDTPYLLYVDGKYQDVVWIPQSPQSSNIHLETSSSAAQRNGRPTGDGNSTDPREVALSALGHVPLPNIQVRANPALGLVNLAGWFWVEGYDGRPFGIERHVTVPAEVGDDVPATDVPLDDPRRRPTHYTVEVKIWPSRYEWDFGDGQQLETHSLGKPQPAESDIQHTYEHSSLGLPNGFPVRLTVTFQAEYRVNGGAAQALPSFQQTYEYGYRVQEMQAILTHR